jgi:hypothetical protein
MRWNEILESLSWTIDPDLEANDTEMRSKFSGHPSDQRHYSQKEMKQFRDPAYLQRMSEHFTKSGTNFNIYVWQSKIPNYDSTAFKSRVNTEWLHQRMPDAADRILAATSPDAITIVLTNNLSDANKVSLSSPWIIAHRIAHALFDPRKTQDKEDDLTYDIRFILRNFVHTVATIGYGIHWPSHDDNYDLHNYYGEIYGKVMGEIYSTMKSAREKKFTDDYEWANELFSQYMIAGKITYNPLPAVFDDNDLTTDPSKRKQIQRTWYRLAEKLERRIDEMLESCRGEIFVC